MVFLFCYFAFGEGYWIAGECLGSVLMARSIWGNCMLGGCFATELRELLYEDQLILQTVITQNVKSQKVVKGAELRAKNVEELNLVFIRLLYINYAFQRLGCSGACLLTKNQNCLQSLLRASAYVASVSGTDCFSLCSRALISSNIFICCILIFFSHLMFFCFSKFTS